MSATFPKNFEVIDFGGLVIQRADGTDWSGPAAEDFMDAFFNFLEVHEASCGGGFECVAAGGESAFSAGREAKAVCARLGIPPAELEAKVKALIVWGNLCMQYMEKGEPWWPATRDSRNRPVPPSPRSRR